MTVRFGRISIDDLREFALEAPTAQPDRERRLLELFEAAGCDGDELESVRVDIEQSNVICTLPGETAATIVVAAHLDQPVRKEIRGTAVSAFGGARAEVLHNWTGCALLPALYQALAVEQRQHTFVFVGFSGLDDGRAGSQRYWHALERDEPPLEAVVNLIALGVQSPAATWRSSDRDLVLDLYSVSRSLKLPLRFVKLRGYEADAETFRRRGVPAITVHSLDQRTAHKLTRPDTGQSASLIDFDEYQSTARLLAGYLAYLDRTIDMRRTQPASVGP